MKFFRRIRPSTVFPFVLGVFSGTLISVYLFLSVRSMNELEAYPPGVAVEGRGEKSDIRLPDRLARDQERESQKIATSGSAKKVTFHRRKLVSYNVLTRSSMASDSRGMAVHKTWAGATSVKKHVNFYLSPGSKLEDNVLSSLKKKMQITRLIGNKEDETIHGKSHQGVFELWKDICERRLNKYLWFVRLKNTVYVQAEKLEKLLTSLNSSKPILLGHSVSPVDDRRIELGLRAGESYCYEGGYAVSWRALELICPHLSACKERAKTENEDMEMARCIREQVGINCTASAKMKELFYVAEGIVSEEDLQTGVHHLNPSLKRAVVLAPLKEPDHFYHLHHYFMREKLNSTKILVNKLRNHLTDTAERVARFGNLLNNSGHRPSPWTRLGVNAPFSSLNPDEEVLHFQSFDDNFMYTESKFRPGVPLGDEMKREKDKVVSAVKEFRAQKEREADNKERENTQTGDSLVLESILQRVDPTRGIDYFVQLTDKKKIGPHKTEFYHVLREIELPKITSMHTPNCKTIKVNFVVATPPVSRGFQRFMLSFENSFLARNPPELVSLLAVLYSDGKFKKYDKDLLSVVSLFDLYRKKYPEADLRLVTTRNAYSRRDTLEIASKEYPTYELLFLADIHVDFSMQFVERCRMNAVENEQVYFPMIFSPYDPAEFHKSRLKFPYATKFKISDELGAWMTESFHLVCLFNYDLLKVLNGDQKEGEGGNWNLLDKFLKDDRLKIFRAVEPGLVHLWQDGCKEEELGSTERMLCQQLSSSDNNYVTRTSD